jgi:hypothetical protein
VRPAARIRQLDHAVDERAEWVAPGWATGLRSHHLSSHAGSAVVLVIDDRSDKRASWCHSADVLRFAGYTVIEATAGEDASQMLAHMRFDAVILERDAPRSSVVHILGRPLTANLEAPVSPEDLVGAVASAIVRGDR